MSNKIANWLRDITNWDDKGNKVEKKALGEENIGLTPKNIDWVFLKDFPDVNGSLDISFNPKTLEIREIKTFVGDENEDQREKIYSFDEEEMGEALYNDITDLLIEKGYMNMDGEWTDKINKQAVDANFSKLRQDNRFDWSRKPTDVKSINVTTVNDSMKELLKDVKTFNVEWQHLFDDNPEGSKIVYIAKVDGKDYLVNTEGYDYPRYVTELKYEEKKECLAAQKSKFPFGSVEWQKEMENKVDAKELAGEPLSEDEKAFVDIQLEHNKRLKEEKECMAEKKEAEKHPGFVPYDGEGAPIADCYVNDSLDQTICDTEEALKAWVIAGGWESLQDFLDEVGVEAKDIIGKPFEHVGGRLFLESSMTKEALKRVKEVNKEINDIFKKHKIKPAKGEEGFWNGVEDVKKINKEDGKKLNQLGKEWDIAWKNEEAAGEHDKKTAEKISYECPKCFYSEYLEGEGNETCPECGTQMKNVGVDKSSKKKTKETKIEKEKSLTELEDKTKEFDNKGNPFTKEPKPEKIEFESKEKDVKVEPVEGLEVEKKATLVVGDEVISTDPEEGTQPGGEKARGKVVSIKDNKAEVEWHDKDMGKEWMPLEHLKKEAAETIKTTKTITWEDDKGRIHTKTKEKIKVVDDKGKTIPETIEEKKEKKEEKAEAIEEKKEEVKEPEVILEAKKDKKASIDLSFLSDYASGKKDAAADINTIKTAAISSIEKASKEISSISVDLTIIAAAIDAIDTVEEFDTTLNSLYDLADENDVVVNVEKEAAPETTCQSCGCGAYTNSEGKIICMNCEKSEKECKCKKAAKKSIEDITKEDYVEYEIVRASGATNMFDVNAVISLSGGALDKEKIYAIMDNYDALKKKYPGVREEIANAAKEANKKMKKEAKEEKEKIPASEIHETDIKSKFVSKEGIATAKEMQATLKGMYDKVMKLQHEIEADETKMDKAIEKLREKGEKELEGKREEALALAEKIAKELGEGKEVVVKTAETILAKEEEVKEKTKYEFYKENEAEVKKKVEELKASNKKLVDDYKKELDSKVDEYQAKVAKFVVTVKTTVEKLYTFPKKAEIEKEASPLDTIKEFLSSLTGWVKGFGSLNKDLKNL